MTTILERLRAGEGLRGLGAIDAHAHVGPWCSFYTPEPTPRQMLREMDRFGVEISCVSSLLAIAADPRLGNDEVAAMLEEAPGRFRGYVTLNPHWTPAENREELLRCLGRGEGFIGIKLHPMWHASPVDGEAYRPLWEQAAGFCPLVLGHSWLGSEEPEGYGDPARYARMAEAYPGVTIIMGHGGGTRAGHLRAADDCRHLPNLFMDICAGEFAEYWLEELLRIAPPRKVLFASDQPFLGLGSPIGRIGYSRVDDEVKKIVFADTMRGIIARALPRIRRS